VVCCVLLSDLAPQPWLKGRCHAHRQMADSLTADEFATTRVEVSLLTAPEAFPVADEADAGGGGAVDGNGWCRHHALGNRQP
jgi:hypothetical protein